MAQVDSPGQVYASRTSISAARGTRPFVCQRPSRTLSQQHSVVEAATSKRPLQMVSASLLRTCRRSFSLGRWENADGDPGPRKCSPEARLCLPGAIDLRHFVAVCLLHFTNSAIPVRSPVHPLVVADGPAGTFVSSCSTQYRITLKCRSYS